MGFSKDLQEFVKSFEGGMKAAAPTAADARLQQMADDRALQAEFKARGDRTAGQAVTGGGGAALSIDDDPERPSPPRYNAAGRVPTFARTDIPGNDLDTVVRTVYGEAANEPPEGQRAVAATIFNRAAKAGTSPKYEALKPAQYEPWSRADARRRMLSLSPNDPTYQRIYGEVVKAQQGDDPTGGATHFFAPKAQAELGRSVPSWASGEGFRIGNHKFYTLPYSGKGRHGTTSPSSQDLIRRTDEKYGSLPRRAALDLQDDDNEEPVAYAASGGLIPNTRYSGFDDNAGSNPVARDVREGAVDIDQTGSVPEQAPPDTSQPVEPARIATAMDAGLKYIQTKLGLGGSALPEASPRTDDAARALAHNVGAADHDQIEAANRAVDPTGEMPAAQRNAMRLVGMYDFMKERGDEQGAARASAAMLMHSKEIARRAGMMTLAAIDKGDWEGASKSLQSAYDYFPDGRSLRAKAGPAGVEYELVDQTGKGLANGAMTKSEVKQLATDMINGKQWFQMVQAATEPANPAAQRAERERQAQEDFYGTLAPEQLDEYRRTLSDEQLAKFNKMSPVNQQKTVDTARRDQKLAFDQFKFDERAKVAQETGDRRMAVDLFKFAVRQNNWATVREQVMDENELRRAQRELEEEGRNTRQQLSFAQREKLQQKIDERILNGRTKTTAKERAATAEEQAYQDRLTEAQKADEADPSQQQVGTVAAERSYQNAIKAAGDRKNVADFETIGTALDKVVAGQKDPSGKAVTVSPGQRHMLSNVAAHMARANLMSEDYAAQLAVQSVAKDTPIGFVRDAATGAVKVKIGNAPPVVLGSDALAQIATLRGGKLLNATVPEPVTGPTPAPAPAPAPAPTSAVPTGQPVYSATPPAGNLPRGVNSAVPQAPGQSGSTTGLPTRALDPINDARIRDQTDPRVRANMEADNAARAERYSRKPLTEEQRRRALTDIEYRRTRDYIRDRGYE